MNCYSESMRPPVADPQKDHNRVEEHLLPKSKNEQLLVFDVGDDSQSGSGNKGDLQANFKKFLQQRKRAIRNRDVVATPASTRTVEEMDELRAKFLARCKAYMGVPYSKKYHVDPESPHHDAPLFLDCCGLIRQALRDLKEDFGFTIGPWNQAYQFDTLPVRLPSHKELVPGDLIFYTGTYPREGAKQQKHEMVHVEVFIGGSTGEQTLGARWGKGTVSIFDSYKFEAKSWVLKEHFFCSISTWLQGVCRSHCDEHPWQRVGHLRVQTYGPRT